MAADAHETTDVNLGLGWASSNSTSAPDAPATNPALNVELELSQIAPQEHQAIEIIPCDG